MKQLVLRGSVATRVLGAFARREAHQFSTALAERPACLEALRMLGAGGCSDSFFQIGIGGFGAVVDGNSVQSIAEAADAIDGIGF